MMAARVLSKALLSNVRTPTTVRAAAYSKEVVGNREVVGYGFNGQANYMDRVDFPMPAVRFREETADIKAIRVKEQGDWHKLTKEEKKALYRASFCQTFSEFQASSGEWKAILGGFLIVSSIGIWLYMGLKLFVYKPLPESFNEANQKAQLKRMLDLRVNPIDGLSSKWDYENNRWK